ncbi:hypothetical protein pipiens_018240 [Culex pipiens pipiens]|uniref:Uncharacterized protein n=1 Tax=Culex pipiens pipiens TaxID=38569 RepID=A0ABD1CDT7_CULPP
MFYLCARLPYSEDHHKDYLGMRNTLQIIAMCSRNAISFGCAGFEKIAGHMFYLCARLPYSEDHHKDYLGMRNTLQIIAMCSREAISFGCAGVSDISVKVFAEMLNNCYSVFTFLREMI